MVELEGEAFFEVLTDSERPFIVRSKGQDARVLGTSFCIRAYPDEDIIVTTLETGSLQVSAGSATALLSPGQQATTQNDQITTREVNPSLYTAWHTGMFLFDNQSLAEILFVLSR